VLFELVPNAAPAVPAGAEQAARAPVAAAP
jgi:hypothetical protein